MLNPVASYEAEEGYLEWLRGLTFQVTAFYKEEVRVFEADFDSLQGVLASGKMLVCEVKPITWRIEEFEKFREPIEDSLI